jgi:(1->4)-alpha-D-glucan 1-alpha-D-glucosylmutase
MIATSTHDTKLGEDVRARINVLSEIPDEWSRETVRWMRLNRPHRTMMDGEPAPDRNDEYRFYQALIGVWPHDGAADGVAAPDPIVERLQAYMIKAVKEAKLHTSWLTPNEAYEAAVVQFVAGVLTGPGAARFLPAFLPLQRRVSALGMLNSLAQLALKIGSPGVPDFYQGTELWDLNLVDPDNRRPVDFAVRRRMLDEVESVLALDAEARKPAIEAMRTGWSNGAIKLLITAAGLRLRREWPEVFLSGSYVPLKTQVTVNAGLVAFARSHEGRTIVVAVPRLCAPIAGKDDALPLGGAAWKTSRILLPNDMAERVFRHEITGADVCPTSAGGETWTFAGEIFDSVPVAILRMVG